ncbi:MAG TPA: hypothetical protein VME01_09325 [Solirubrobacteraceae bacterium]|nr:hypothetical protein [Solirubrobacteraceae bacterium]
MRHTTLGIAAAGAVLVAGCGTATRLDFRGRSRPATPLEVSVYYGSNDLLVDPRTFTPGPVQFNITNQSSDTVMFALSSTSSSTSIPPGATGQITVDLTRPAYVIQAARALRRNHTAVRVAILHRQGPARTGNSALLQP